MPKQTKTALGRNRGKFSSSLWMTLLVVCQSHKYSTAPSPSTKAATGSCQMLHWCWKKYHYGKESGQRNLWASFYLYPLGISLFERHFCHFSVPFLPQFSRIGTKLLLIMKNWQGSVAYQYNITVWEGSSSPYILTWYQKHLLLQTRYLLEAFNINIT